MSKMPFSFTTKAGALIGILCVGISGAPGGASAAPLHYQEQISLTCSVGFCVGGFPKIDRDSKLVLDGVFCEGSVQNGSIEQAYVSFNFQQRQFILPLALDWQRAVGSFNSYTFSRQSNVEVPGAQQPTVALAYQGVVPTGRCTLSGTLKPK